jgi:mRNA export factor
MWSLGDDSLKQVAAHDAAVSGVRWVESLNAAVTASWDGSLRYWDMKSDSPQATVECADKIHTMDACGGALVVGMAERKISIFDLSSPEKPFRDTMSKLGYQSRRIRVMRDGSGWGMGSIEGRCSIRYMDEGRDRGNKEGGDSFSFKCHRVARGSTADVYPVHTVDFHPDAGFADAFSTCGGDGSISFWDKSKKARLDEIRPLGQDVWPVVDGRFNAQGDLYAYALSYDWGKGAGGYDKSKSALYITGITPERLTQKK